MHQRHRHQNFLLCLALLSSGCSTLVGNVKGVDQKSETYGFVDLSKEKPSDWQKLDPAQVDGEEKSSAANASEISDAVFQAKRSAATISINSACRQDAEPPASGENELRKTTNLLLLGLSDVTLREERKTTVHDTPALQTTVRGKMNHEDVMLRTVVLRHGSCVYDLVYLTPPASFSKHEQDFSHFVASLRLKE